MVIQTEVTLQADHVLSAGDGGEIPHCRNFYLIDLPAYPSSTIVILVVLTFCPRGGITSRHCSL